MGEVHSFISELTSKIIKYDWGIKNYQYLDVFCLFDVINMEILSR